MNSSSNNDIYICVYIYDNNNPYIPWHLKVAWCFFSPHREVASFMLVSLGIFNVILAVTQQDKDPQIPRIPRSPGWMVSSNADILDLLVTNMYYPLVN
jgi:hypothetical protein